MVNRLEKPVLLRPVCCPRDFINEPDTSNRCKGLGRRAGYKPCFCLFVRKDEISEWYSLFYVHNTTSLQAWVFQHLLYIWLLNKYLLITKIKKYTFFHLLWERHMLGTGFSLIQSLQLLRSRYHCSMLQRNGLRLETSQQTVWLQVYASSLTHPFPSLFL